MPTLIEPTPRRLSSRPDSELLAVDTGMGAVTLRVADLDAETAYYRDGVLLTVLEQRAADPTGPARVVLGRGAVPIVVLESAPELKRAGPHEAGLFHVAIVFDEQRALAAALYSIARRYPGTFVGSSDHRVSEAFYFVDPEGNGVELYWDRDRTEWSWVHGLPQMGGSHLDPNRFLSEHLAPSDLDAISAASGSTDGSTTDGSGARVGHVHLSVGDLATARDFYVDKLGFEEVAELGGTALFVSAGGYHHHMAMNVWNARGAGFRRPTLGLGLVRIDLPGTDGIGELDERLRFHGVRPGHDEDALLFDDPWGNAVRVATSPDADA